MRRKSSRPVLEAGEREQFRSPSQRLVGFTPPNGPPQRDIAGLQPLHEQVVALLGASCDKLYKVDE
jgi:hypothetical protein